MITILNIPFLSDHDHEKRSKKIDRTVKNRPALTAELERTQSRGFRR